MPSISMSAFVTITHLRLRLTRRIRELLSSLLRSCMMLLRAADPRGSITKMSAFLFAFMMCEYIIARRLFLWLAQHIRVLLRGK